MGEKGTVIGKQQLSEKFLDSFCVCEETPKVEKTAVCLETDVDAVWQVLFCLTEHDAEEDGEQWGDGVQVLSGNNHELSFQNNMLHYILALPFMQFGI